MKKSIFKLLLVSLVVKPTIVVTLNASVSVAP